MLHIYVLRFCSDTRTKHKKELFISFSLIWQIKILTSHFIFVSVLSWHCLPRYKLKGTLSRGLYKCIYFKDHLHPFLWSLIFLAYFFDRVALYLTYSRPHNFLFLATIEPVYGCRIAYIICFVPTTHEGILSLCLTRVYSPQGKRLYTARIIQGEVRDICSRKTGSFVFK